MFSNTLDKISFWALFLTVTILPFFFLPFSKISVENSKSLLLVVGLSVSIIAWAAARFSDGKIVLPKSWIMISGFGLVVAFFISALFSVTLKVSFFGLMLDMGTFYFILASFLLMLMSSIVFKNKKNTRMLLAGFIVSSLVVLFFQIIHFFLPKMTSLGILFNKTDNLIGSFNSLAIFSALFIIVSIFILEFFTITKKNKIIFSVFTLLSVLMVMVVNFSLVWVVLGIFALLIFIFKVSLSITKQKEEKKRNFPVASFIVVIVSLMFFISGQFIGGFLPNLLGISNTEIRPTLSTTMAVSKDALKKDPILGVGPNKFTEVWNLYKPESINNTIFWDTSFTQGSGLLPTFVATTGILGILAIVLFLVLILFAGYKLFSLSKGDEKLNMDIVIFYIMSLYLFIVAFFYPISQTLFLLAFAFLGAFIGILMASKEKGECEISFLNDARKSFFAILLLVVIMILSLAVVFRYMERFVSIVYFQKAVVADSIEKAEVNINRAVSLYQNDLYLRTYAQIYMLKTNSLIAKASQGQLSETEKAEVQINFDQAVKSAELATAYNKTNYLNFEALGSVYENSVSFGSKDAFEKSVEAYKKASTLSPKNPILQFDLARLYFTSQKFKEAKEYATNAFNLKGDYVDALILLSQIAKNEGNSKESIAYAEAAVFYYPQNKELKQYLDLLKGDTTKVEKNKEE